MLKEKQRRIFAYTCRHSAIPTEVDLVDFEKIVELLIKIKGTPLATYPYLKNRLLMRLVDAKVDQEKDVLILLLSNADKDTAPPAFENFVSGNVRVEDKQEEEGIAFSCHIVISLSSTDNHGLIRSAAIERVPGVDRTTIISALKSMLKKGAQHYHSDWVGKDGKPYRPTLLFSSKASKSLKSALSSGRIDEVELVRYDVDEFAVDVPAGLEPVKYTLQLKPKLKTDEGKTVIGVIDKALDYAKANKFQRANVMYRNEANQTKQIPMMAGEGDPGEILFNMSEIVELDHMLPQRCSTIRMDLVDKMIEQL